MIRYGVRKVSVGDAVVLLAPLLGITFELHDSSFYGGDYYLAEVTEGKVYVQPNLDLLDDEPFEHEWPVGQCLLSFDAVKDDVWDHHRALLAPLEVAGVVCYLRTV